MASLPTLHLKVLRGDAVLAQGSFTEESVTIGSDATAMLRVDDPTVAGLHAVLNVAENGSVELLDVGAEPGIVLRDQRIFNAPLASGDVFGLGDVSVVATWDEADVTDYGRPAARAVAAAADETEGPQGEVDVLEMIVRSSADTPNGDRKAPRMLEVSHIWGNVLLDKKSFHVGSPVTIGPSFGFRWKLFGRTMGWVPENTAALLRVSPPVWSEVDEVWSSDFYVPSDLLPLKDDLQIFTADARGWTARVSKSWDGFIDADGQRYTFEAAVAAGKARTAGEFYEVSVTEGMDLALQIGEVIFFGRLVQPSLQPTPFRERDTLFAATSSISAFLFALIALVMAFRPPESEAGSAEEQEEILEALIQQEQLKAEEKKKDDKPKNEDAGEGAKAKDEEGKTGKENAKMKEAKGEKVAGPAADKEAAEDAGLLGALNDPNNMLSAGLDPSLSSGIGGLIGAHGTQMGAGGLGMRGGGVGGGGTASGLGGLGSRGTGLGGSGSGSGGGYFGEGGGDLSAKKTTRAPSAGTGDAIVMGSLDKSLIDKVVKSKMSTIKYCYSRELTKNPNLAGKVTIKFTIAGDGKVSAASVATSDLGSSAAESCIVKAFYTMQFPEPKGGGIVVVKYPFIFSGG
jgi:hypothetical protein